MTLRSWVHSAIKLKYADPIDSSFRVGCGQDNRGSAQNLVLLEALDGLTAHDLTDHEIAAALSLLIPARSTASMQSGALKCLFPTF